MQAAPKIAPRATALPFQWNYAVSSSAPASGGVSQIPVQLNSLAFSDTDASGADRTAFLGTINTNYAIVSQNQVWYVTSTGTGTGVTSFGIKPTVSSTPGLRTFNFVLASTIAQFPAFTPIVPPPVIGVGGGPPPAFPPPTPPPIGQVPVGVLVGPAISPAGVPPSLAGVVQPQYRTGSATVPAANGYFPKFTTTFPVPTIVVGGFMNSGTGQAGKSPPFVNTPPPSTPSTPPIVISGIPLAMAGPRHTIDEDPQPHPEPESAPPEPEPEPEPAHRRHKRPRK